MTAIDLAGVADATLHSAADLLVRHGLAYLQAWGADCERWHDVVDRVNIDRLTSLGVYPEGAWDPLMTTWHARQSLHECVWGFRWCGMAAGHYNEDCRDAILAATSLYLDQARVAFYHAGRPQ
ncbi:MAG TPA: hypothetical protein VM865_07035 [Acidobacteriaceae bacterium]|jgi:hypothetical protein|nr:hypothetical protein [Acidobacteriaceae bacterium]